MPIPALQATVEADAKVPVVSPAGRTLVRQRELKDKRSTGGSAEDWVVVERDGSRTKLPRDLFQPTMWVDERRFLVSSDKLVSVDPGGTASSVRLLPPNNRDNGPAVPSPDGKRIMFLSVGPAGDLSLYATDLQPGAVPPQPTKVGSPLDPSLQRFVPVVWVRGR